MEEIKLAVAYNLEEATSLEGISEWKNPLTYPTSDLCATHLTPMRQDTTPMAPKKAPRPRIFTDTRDDLLDDPGKDPLTRTCLPNETTPEINRLYAAREAPCTPLICSYCPNPVQLSSEE